MKTLQAKPLPARAGELREYMRGLRPDAKRLAEIQSAYDNLALLGQLLCAGTDISAMRQAFGELADSLLAQLADEHFRKAVLGLESSARAAIDVMVRNLYERTADIGFLATDTEIVAFARNAGSEAGDTGERTHLQARFAEYVDKYTVYHDVVLLSPQGEILARLDSANPLPRTSDAFVATALSGERPYLEVFRRTDLLPDDANPLIYACRVSDDDGTPLGVLCLCFRFQDECERIFANLLGGDDWRVLTLADGEGRILASSDPWQFPPGARLAMCADGAPRIARFAGREYLACGRPGQAYQGYAGPGWYGLALAPLEHAFDLSAAHELAAVAEDFLACVLETTTLLSSELRRVPREAARIQNDLNRAVWNGHVWLAREPEAAQSGSFAKVLLSEIGNTGVRTRAVFGESINNLYKTVISSALFDASAHAAMAIDIMERNLYERANDCRWWALTGRFRAALAAAQQGEAPERAPLTAILRQLNKLYTVYTNLILFDQGGRVVAVSNPAYNDCVGRVLDEPWLRPTLALTDSGCYVVSPFRASALYDGRPSYVFAAAVLDPQGREPVGGIALVFDAEPQLQAMLHDALPRAADGRVAAGAFAVFADRQGHVIASTDDELTPGTPLMIGNEFFHVPPGQHYSNVIIYNGRYYAVGSAAGAGYREYPTERDGRTGALLALIFTPLSERVIDPAMLPEAPEAGAAPYRRHGQGESLDIACFHIGRNWYGLRADCVIEAVDIDRLTPMPGLPDGQCGCLMYGEQAIGVIDPALMLRARQPDEERRRPQPGGRRQILVLRSPARQAMFAILVDRLAPVREVPLARVEPLPALMSEGDSLIESLVRPGGEDGERRILMVLGVDRILKRSGMCAMPEEGSWLPGLLGRNT
ncbi:chemotaxis protein CheW [Azonexus caeni]|uniref:chemotaxis protein CheW n=1 Tax=Azonexus caeni TaxID=266126 RepID=UPI003A8BAC0B